VDRDDTIITYARDATGRVIFRTPAIIPVDRGALCGVGPKVSQAAFFMNTYEPNSGAGPALPHEKTPHSPAEYD